MYSNCIYCHVFLLHEMQTHPYYIQILLPFLPISHIVHTSRCTDLFVEVTNVTKGNRIWAHFVSTRYFPSQIQLSRLIQKDDVQIETVCCICHAHQDGGNSQSGTRHSLPPARRRGGFNSND